MGNNGNSRDKKILWNYICREEHLPTYPDEDHLQIRFKEMMNDLISKSEWISCHYFGRRTKYNTVHNNNALNNLVMKINSLRMRYWYWSPINAEYVKPKRRK